VHDPIFILDAPHYHRVQVGQLNRFRGLVLALPVADGAVSAESDAANARADASAAVRAVVVREAAAIRAEAAVDRESADLARVTSATRPPGADRCRFELDLDVRSGTAYVFYGRCADGREVPLFVYDTALAQRDADGQDARLRAASVMPMPPRDLLIATQGGDDVEAYRDSLLSAHTTLRSLLFASGIDPARVRNVLDIGCGTGRLLAGWHLDDAVSRELVGVDIDPACIAWNREHLPGVARWEVSALDPPLPFDSASFDLVLLASVFTHLSLDRQQRWARELARLIRPDGAAIVTLCGEPYAALLLDPDRQRLLRDAGHVEVESGDEGGATYVAFHEPRFARGLFSEAFTHVDLYPRGIPHERGAASQSQARANNAHVMHTERGRALPTPPHLFPMAALQDVYILRGPRSGPT
jgi:SAM-dependent methyltransferase